VLTTLINLCLMPFYVGVLGIEAYGLIGFFLTVQVMFSILDMGLSATLTRQLAQYRYSGVGHDQQRDLVRTLEWIYWPVALCIAATVWVMSKWIATAWLHPVSLTLDQTSQAIALMGLVAAVQWPNALCAGGFRGLERQVLLNGLSVGFGVGRALGAVLVLLYVSPSLSAFLWWQVAAAAIQTASCWTVLWRILPNADRAPQFSRAVLKSIRGFTAGMAGIALVSFFLVQSDRILLSTILPLNEFGYYTVAATAAAALLGLVSAFYNALFPRYSALVASGQADDLIALYHASNQYLATVVGPVAAVICLFSKDVLLMWTHNSEIAQKSGPILSVLVAGTGLHSLMHLPSALQLANGWTKLSLRLNLAAIILVVPAMWFATAQFGGIGAAWVWVALNVGYLAIGIPLMHRRLLPSEMKAWYLIDVFPAFLASAATAATARMMFPTLQGGMMDAAVLALIGFVTLGAATLAAPFSRQQLARQAQKLLGLATT
jgi:O-antigen/teichoic acid export membrane protein